MQEAQAIIERIRRVSATIQRIDVAVEKIHREVNAGQLFLARTTDSFDPYLREPWIPVNSMGSTVTIERPANRLYAPGQIVNLLGPVGKPIPLRDSTRSLLLIAYDSTPAALLMLADVVLNRGGAVTLVLIGRARYYPLDTLRKEMEVVRIENSEAWNERDKTLGWADQVVTVAPPTFNLPIYARLLEQIRQVRIEVASDYAYGLFHWPMPCGVGACQACLVRLTGGEENAACLEGPAFDLLTVSLITEQKAGDA